MEAGQTTLVKNLISMVCFATSPCPASILSPLISSTVGQESNYWLVQCNSFTDPRSPELAPLLVSWHIRHSRVCSTGWGMHGDSNKLKKELELMEPFGFGGVSASFLGFPPVALQLPSSCPLRWPLSTSQLWKGLFGGRSVERAMRRGLRLETAHGTWHMESYGESGEFSDRSRGTATASAMTWRPESSPSLSTRH